MKKLTKEREREREETKRNEACKEAGKKRE